MTSGEEEILQLFIEESREHLENIEEDFLAIEQAGENYPEELINKTFRNVHTIKGGASLFSFKNISDLSHEMENVLGKIREKELKPDSEIISALLDGADLLKTMVNNPDQSGKCNISKVVEQLKSFLTNETAALPKKTEPPQDGIPVLNDQNEQIAFLKYTRMQEAENAEHGGMFIYKIKLDLGDGTVQAKRNADIILTSCKDFSSVIEFIDQSELNNCYYIICSTFMEVDMFREIVGLPENSVSPVWSGTANQPQTLPENALPENVSQENAPAMEIPPPETDDKTPDKTSDVPVQEQPKADFPETAPPSVNTSVRVNVVIIDKLIALASELVLTRNQLMLNASTQNKTELLSITKRLNRITTSLQKVIMSTRLQPISIIYSKFKRLVRATAESMEKDVEARIEGEDVEVDRTVIDLLSDSLVHLVRNSVDHGIESPEIRARAGKPSRGFISLKTSHEAGQVVIDFEDDGGGINLKKIGEQAVLKGWITETQLLGMTEKDLLEIVLRPGISTAKKISSISGRGVGMDIIHTNISRYGGVMEIKTVFGKGTLIRIKLPLTLAIMPGLITGVEKEYFIIPQVNVVEIVRITPESILGRIEKIGNVTAIRIREELLPVARISDILKIPRTWTDLQTGKKKLDRRKNIADRREKGKAVSEQDERRAEPDRRKNRRDAVNVVIVTTGEYKYGLIVSSILNSSEIVIKALGSHLIGCSEFAGATILPNGKVALILNVPGIREVLDLRKHSTYYKKREEKHDAEQMEFNDLQSFLIIRSCSEDRFAVPLGIISRIEKIQVSLLSTNTGKVVIPYHDGSLPLIYIEDIIGGQKKLENNTVYVLIFVAGGHEIGILANEI
ncbi:MAG: chemotaxis protein CheA, partial [Fibrobacter sp.]|nr:chemotaxis protein CheA [Fibrobacter sp.]